MRMHESKCVLSFKFFMPLSGNRVICLCQSCKQEKQSSFGQIYPYIGLVFCVHIRQNTVMNVLSNRGQEWYAAES
jgi:hypothetical protein